MSVINKQPFIEKVVASLSKENLTSLQSLINGSGTPIFRSFINTANPMSTSDKGVANMVLEVEDNVFTGYLLYNNSYCVLVAYEGDKSQKMFSIKLDYAHDKYEIINEELDINEFRRVVEDRTTNVEIEGNDVSANPELSGEEAMLTGIEIDGTKYKAYGDSNVEELLKDDEHGFSFSTGGDSAGLTKEYQYAGVSKVGNVLKFVIEVFFTRTDKIGSGPYLGYFTIPDAIFAKIRGISLSGGNYASFQKVLAWQSDSTSKELSVYALPIRSNKRLYIQANATPINNNLDANTKYFIRYELELLLSDNLYSA